MKGYALLLLSSLLLACRGSNTTFTWTSSSLTSASSSSNGRIGDWVAAGIGLSAHEVSSTLTSLSDTGDGVPIELDSASSATSVSSATTTSEAPAQTSSPGSRIRTQSSKPQVPITVGATGVVSATSKGSSSNITRITTAADCWHSWLEYWSKSSENTPYEAMTGHNPKPGTSFELQEQVVWVTITTSSYVSWFSTDAVDTTETISSDGFAVSVATTRRIITSSKVGWFTETTDSSVTVTTVTVTYTEGYYDEYDITVPATLLPTPACKLPAIMPECSEAWSSYIYRDSYVNMDPFGPMYPGKPDCTQVAISDDWCTSIRSLYVSDQISSGQTSDIGWVTADNTSHFPASTMLAPGCSLGCQECSITGESVQLYYWPPSTLAVVENGTETATVTSHLRNPSSPRTFLVNGTTLTSPTIYISYDILYAANSCGALGQTYRNTIVPLLNTNHLFSLESVFASHGFLSGYETSSFNFADLMEPIPNSIYDKQIRCMTSSISWELWANYTTADFTCARTAPYAPIIAVPPEARALDPAWESCGAWYGGLFDPPRALQPADAIATPTLPAAATAPEASPQSTVDSDLATRTPAPVTTSLDPITTHSQNGIEATRASSTAGPTESTDDPGSNAPDIEQSAKSAGNEHSDFAGPQSTVPTLQEQSNGAAAILSVFLTQVNLASEQADSDPTTAPASEHNAADLTQASPTMTSGGSPLQFDNSIPGASQPAATAASESSQLDDAKTSAGTSSDSPEGVAAILSIFMAQSEAEVEHSGDFSTVSGSAPHVEDLVDGKTLNSPADPGVQNKLSTVLNINEHTYTVNIQSGTTFLNEAPASVGATITTDGNVFTIGSDMVDFQGTRISLYNADPGTPSAISQDVTAAFDHTFTISDTVYTASAIPDQLDAVLLTGQTIASGRPAGTIDGQVITYGQDGISVFEPAESRTTVSAVSDAQPLLTIDDFTYTATLIPGRTDAVILQDQTVSINGKGTIITDHLASKSSDSNAKSVAHPTSTASSTASSSPSPGEAAESSAVQHDPAGKSEQSAACQNEHVVPGLFLWVAMSWMVFKCS